MDINSIFEQPCEAIGKITYSNYITARDDGWPKHNVPNPELIYIVDGKMTAEDPDNPKCILKPGDIVLLRPGKPCDLIVVEEGKTIISCIHFDVIKDRKIKSSGSGLLPWVVNTKGDLRLLELFKLCATEFKGYNPYREELLSTMLREIILRMSAHRNEHITQKVSARTERMVDYIRNNLNKKIDRHDLSKNFLLSPEHINYLFKKELNMTPTQCQNRERILLASRKLQEGCLNVSQVAHLVGFADEFYFSRVFKKIMGFPPKRLISG